MAQSSVINTNIHRKQETSSSTVLQPSETDVSMVDLTNAVPDIVQASKTNLNQVMDVQNELNELHELMPSNEYTKLLNAILTKDGIDIKTLRKEYLRVLDHRNKTMQENAKLETDILKVKGKEHRKNVITVTCCICAPFVVYLFLPPTAKKYVGDFAKTAVKSIHAA